MAQPGSAVLVAEDNEDIRELVVHQLRRMGVEVLQAGNGRQAIDLALAEQPALVLMDMDMPVMSGFEAVAQLRLCGYTKPILALTPITRDDWESIAVANNPKFLAIIERSRKSQKPRVSTDEMRRRLGLKRRIG